MKNNETSKKSIPIFFATDDNYVPYLDVAIGSMLDNASKEYFYDIHILNAGLKFENRFMLKRHETNSETNNVSICFDNISKYIEGIKKNFQNLYHFSLATYYRLFIQSLFPEYSKILYLDCDIVVTGDISKLWEVDLGDNMIAGVVEKFIATTPEFRDYANYAVGVNPDKYINAGILSINLDKFREYKVEETFSYLLSTYNFDTVDPDQMYLNYLCNGRVLHLPCGWNYTQAYEVPEGGMNIIHYALAKKPWQFDGVPRDEYFWKYAEKSKFYKRILKFKANFSDEAKAKKEQAGIDIVRRAADIVKNGKTFCNTNVENPFKSELIVNTKYIPTNLAGAGATV